ncbi:MAG: YegS/Rv2252/BmrU family lipid kinase [Clostridia bacterium]|nr:YegS/Rv2252/BmrU family lipid kinase [Clostridia bacterium]
MAVELLLIINPQAGLKKFNRYTLDVIEKFTNAGYVCTVCTTSKETGAVHCIEKFGAKADVIVCVGGDGTFSEVISGMRLAGIKRPVGYIPAGSTNDFGNSIGLPKNFLRAVDDIIEGTPQNYDLGSFNGKGFSYIASFGIFSSTSYTTPRNLKNTIGHLAYLLSSVKELSNIRPIHVRVETKEQIFEDDYIFGAISNSLSFAGVLSIDPNKVKMDDGAFELMLIRMPKNIIDVSKIVTCLTNQVYDPNYITFCSIDAAKIQLDEEIPWTLDGEYQPGSDIIDFHVLPSAVQIIMNRKSNQKKLLTE